MAALGLNLRKLLDVSKAKGVTVEQTITALTPQQVLAALKKHIDPSRLSIVTAGDFSGKTARHQAGRRAVRRATAIRAIMLSNAVSIR